MSDDTGRLPTHTHATRALRLFSCDGYRTRTVSVFNETARDRDLCATRDRYPVGPNNRGQLAARFGSALFCTPHNVEEA